MKFALSLIISVLFFGISSAQTQNWVSSSQGILDSQMTPFQLSGYHINFKSRGPFGKDWIYGHWLDEDTLIRHVAYRDGGKWKSLPFYTEHYSSYTVDIVQYGDTMYIGGLFGVPYLDKDSVALPNANILKYWPDGDSIWASDLAMWHIQEMEASGDSLLINCSVYLTPTDTMGGHLLSTDGGQSWVSAFDESGPDKSYNWGGPRSQMEIREGKIFVLYEGTGVYNGVVSWDGHNWKGYGQGFHGGVWMIDFEFYKDQLFLGGTFSRAGNPQNPGDGIVGLNGQYWENTGGGIYANQGGFVPGGVEDLFSEMDVLFAQANATYYGDAFIPYLAGWDGYRWCGTPITYGNNRPISFGVIKDTLYAVFPGSATANGVSMGYLNYFDGDYLHGPNAVCSTPGLGEGETESAEAEIMIYPNPAKDILTISLPDIPNNSNYEILALDGRVVQSGVLQEAENSIKTERKLSGVYLLKIRRERGMVVRKVVFEN